VDDDEVEGRKTGSHEERQLKIFGWFISRTDWELKYASLKDQFDLLNPCLQEMHTNLLGERGLCDALTRTNEELVRQLGEYEQKLRISVQPEVVAVLPEAKRGRGRPKRK
jgi:hypothetical protein